MPKMKPMYKIINIFVMFLNYTLFFVFSSTYKNSIEKAMNSRNTFFIALIAFALLASCQKETPEPAGHAQQTPAAQTLLGKKLPIPFTVEVMQEAYDNLKHNPTAIKAYPLAAKGEAIQITASHYYYRFLPKDSLQYETLVNDTILMVSDVPFEYEIATEGDYYQDPELQDSDFTYYYATVAANHALPEGIETTQLAELYFPPEEDTQTLDKTSAQFKDFSPSFFDDLETEAFKITNTLDEKDLQSLRFINPDGEGASITYAQAQEKGYLLSELSIDYSQNPFHQRPRWEPHGRVTVEEDAIDQVVGVMGAEIRVRKWGFLVIRKATTDEEGYFTTRSTRTQRVKYAIYFKHVPHGFTVKAGTVFWDARHRSKRKHKREGWSQHFKNGSRSHLYALVHNAAFDYYDRVVEEYGIQKPRSGIRISAKFDRDVSSQSRPHLPLVSDIRITRIRHGAYRGSDGIYATTVHELTHAGHRKLDTHMFDFLTTNNKERDLMKESWAEGVETIVTNDRYQALDPGYYDEALNIGWNDWRQNEQIPIMNEYTPIVADLIDNYNQNVELGGARPFDRVSGYTLQQIQSALNNSGTLLEWEQKLRWNFDNPTESYLSELFEYVNEVYKNL